jgi:hypothetical protein
MATAASLPARGPARLVAGEPVRPARLTGILVL